MTNDEKLHQQFRTIYRTGGKPMVTCPVCGTKFQYKPTPRFKKFCSAACRVAHNRKRKADAKKLLDIQ